MKSKTLEFFSKTLPILKADDTLPKVAKYEDKIGILSEEQERTEREVAAEEAKIRESQRRQRVVVSRTDAMKLRLQKKLDQWNDA